MGLSSKKLTFFLIFLLLLAFLFLLYFFSSAYLTTPSEATPVNRTVQVKDTPNLGVTLEQFKERWNKSEQKTENNFNLSLSDFDMVPGPNQDAFNHCFDDNLCIGGTITKNGFIRDVVIGTGNSDFMNRLEFMTGTTLLANGVDSSMTSDKADELLLMMTNANYQDPNLSVTKQIDGANFSYARKPNTSYLIFGAMNPKDPDSTTTNVPNDVAVLQTPSGSPQTVDPNQSSTKKTTDPLSTIQRQLGPNRYIYIRIPNGWKEVDTGYYGLNDGRIRYQNPDDPNQVLVANFSTVLLKPNDYIAQKPISNSFSFNNGLALGYSSSVESISSNPGEGVAKLYPGIGDCDVEIFLPSNLKPLATQVLNSVQMGTTCTDCD